MNTNPTIRVMANFTKTNIVKLVLTKLATMGLSSWVPKYTVPITVVKQSMEPIKISIKLAIYLNKKISPEQSNPESAETKQTESLNTYPDT